MKKLVFAAILGAMGLGGTSCASIVTRSIYSVNFDSEPQGAHLTIENRDGRVVYEGRTPATVPLESSSSYMRRENYKITYQQPWGEPVTTYLQAQVNGWYFGNLLFGGWIGMLIVDPLTGAMYRIPQYSGTVTIEGEAPTAVDSDSGSISDSMNGSRQGADSGSGAVPIRRVPDEAMGVQSSDDDAAVNRQGEWTPLGE